jgi:hypothetical protein
MQVLRYDRLPAFGFLPWLAFLRLALSLRIFVFWLTVLTSLWN